MPVVTSYELAERWNARDPLARIGIAPEPPSTGFAMRTYVNGIAQYVGDPAAIEAMKASFAADTARQVAASHGSAKALGPLAGTVA